MDAVLAQLDDELFVEGIVASMLTFGFAHDLVEHLFGIVPDELAAAEAEAGQTSQGRHAHAEEFVQVRRVDSEELEPVDQRHAQVFGFLEQSLVEGQPADFLRREQIVGQLEPRFGHGLSSRCAPGWS